MTKIAQIIDLQTARKNLSRKPVCSACGLPDAKFTGRYSSVDDKCIMTEEGSKFCNPGCMLLFNAKKGIFPTGHITDEGLNYKISISVEPIYHSEVDAEWLKDASLLVVSYTNAIKKDIK